MAMPWGCAFLYSCLNEGKTDGSSTKLIEKLKIQGSYEPSTIAETLRIIHRIWKVGFHSVQAAVLSPQSRNTWSQQEGLGCPSLQTHVSYWGHVAKSGLISKMLSLSHFKPDKCWKKTASSYTWTSTHLMACKNDLEANLRPSISKLSYQWLHLSGTSHSVISRQKSPHLQRFLNQCPPPPESSKGR